MIYILIIGLLVLNFLIWFFTLKPINLMSNKLSVQIRLEILPDIQKFLNLLTTLSSASIVLTFSVLQVFLEKIVVCKELLVSSWILFSLSIFMAVIAVNFIFIYRAQQMVMIKVIEDHLDKKSLSERKDSRTEVRKERVTVRKTEKVLFSVIYISTASFFNAIILFTVFAVINV